jgi:predicted RNA methylase
MFDFNLPITAIPEKYREFLPSLTTPAVDDLLYQYEKGEAEMRRLHAELMSAENRSVLSSFAYGAELYYDSKSKGRFWAMDLIEMFDLPRAINARQEKYWFQLFDLCSFTNILPAKLWEQWKDSFTAWRVKGGAGIPSFDRSTVYRCLSMVEAHRANFFSMRVEAVWNGLSHWHKTNVGSGFYERMILDWMYSDHGTPTSKDRVFVDLVNLCAVVMTGAEDPFFSSYGVLRDARAEHCGEWVDVLDGALQIRAYKRGTLHIDIHPEVASRLNIALAYIRPNALPDEATLKKPRRKSGFGSTDLMTCSIPRQVRSYLHLCRQEQREDGLWMLVPWKAGSLTGRLSGAVNAMIDGVLAQIGGVRDGNAHLFDYAPMEVVAEVVRTGEVPDKLSHQYFSTPADLAQEFVEWVGVEQQAICYETSAGTGGIAKHMPLQTYCVEVDRLRAMALDKMGFEVKRADFLSLTPDDLHGLADVVLMNPPFAGRAWQDHFEHARKFVRAGGVIGAILPEGARLKLPELDGGELVYSAPLKNRFKDASISVVFAKWVRAGASATAEAEHVRPAEGVSEAA